MDFLVIAGQVIPMVDAQRQTERDGDSHRTADSSLRSAYFAEKVTLTGTTGLLTAAELTTLRTATALGAHVAVSGTGPGAITAEVMLGQEAAVNVEGGDGTGVMWTVGLTVREV